MTPGMAMISFQEPWVLLLALFLPLWWLWRRRRGPERASLPFGAYGRLAGLPRTWRDKIGAALPVLEILAFLLIVLALARPQEESVELLSGEGVDIMLAVDMSGSMNAVDRSDGEIMAIQLMGRDPSNRFEIAQDVLKTFVASRREDRVGLVVFGEEAFLKFPLTLDYMRIMDALSTLVLDNGVRRTQGGGCSNHCTISGGATAIGDALARAYARLKDSDSKSKNIILITDGKNNRSSIDPMTIATYIAEQPAKRTARVFTILVGSGETTKVPSVDPFGRGVAKNRAGLTVYNTPSQPFPTDPALLKEIAEMTGGEFFESNDEARFREVFEKLEKTEFEIKTATRATDRFDLPLGLALLLLGIRATLGWTVLRRTI